jgi:hypothetical protein
MMAASYDPLDYTAHSDDASVTSGTPLSSAPQSYDPLDYTVYPNNGARAVTQPPADNQPPPSLLSRAWTSLADIPREIANPTPATDSGPPGVGKSLGEGFVRGIHDVASPPTTWLLRQLGIGDAATQAADERRKQFDQQYGDSTAASIGRAVGQTVATAPVLGAGGMAARAAAEAVPAIAPAVTFLGGGARAAPDAGLLARLGTALGSLGAQGAVTGAVTGAATAPPDQSTAAGALQGATTGAIAGPVIGAATYPMRALAGRVANMTTPDIAGWAQKAADYGVNVDPSKLTTNPTYKLIGDQTGKLPFSGVDETAQRRQWQGAVAKLFGENTDNGITYDVMGRAADRIGGVFNDIADRTTIQGGTPLQTDLTNIAMEMPQYGLTEAQKTPLKAQFQNVLNAFQDGDGQITGKAYQNLTQTGGPLDSVVSSNDPTVAAFGMKIKNALDNAFQRSVSPEDQAALTQARQQYRALKTVQPLVEQRGAMGDVNPNALQQRVIEQSRRFDPSTGGFAYTGGGQIGDLANIGKIFFSPQADSGTAARNVVLGGLMGGGLSQAIAHPLIPAGIAATLAANRLLQTGIRSPAVGRAMVQGTLNPASRGAQFSNRYLVPGATNLLGIGNQSQ